MQDPVTRFADAAERDRLEQCAREAIRTPGRIQSHGRLLGVDPATSTVTVISENAAGWLGRRVTDLGSSSLEWAIASGSPVDATVPTHSGIKAGTSASPAPCGPAIRKAPSARPTGPATARSHGGARREQCNVAATASSAHADTRTTPPSKAMP